jgi:hypothetical protein
VHNIFALILIPGLLWGMTIREIHPSAQMAGDNASGKNIVPPNPVGTGPFIRGSAKSREIDGLFNQKVLP